jgi:AraC family transcriptional regulator
VELAPDAVRALLPYADFERYATHSARGVPAALAFRLYRAFAGGRDALEIDAEELLLELLTSASQRCRCDRTTMPTWLRRTQARLHDEYGRPLSLSMLAADAGVHPVYLARAFRRRFNCSIGDYLHGRRLDAAVERLIAGGQGVLELGLDVGFYDQSHFTRRFKRAVGLPPGAFRALARQTTRS